MNAGGKKDLIQERVQLIIARNKEKIFHRWLSADFHMHQVNPLFSKQNNIERLK